jgi:hypothetical protein
LRDCHGGSRPLGAYIEVASRGGDYAFGGDLGVILQLAHFESSHTLVSARLSALGSTGKVFSLLPLLQSLQAAPRSTVACS